MTEEAKIAILMVLVFLGILLIGHLNKKSFDACMEKEFQNCLDRDEINCMIKAQEVCEFKAGGF